MSILRDVAFVGEVVLPVGGALVTELIVPKIAALSEQLAKDFKAKVDEIVKNSVAVIGGVVSTIQGIGTSIETSKAVGTVLGLQGRLDTVSPREWTRIGEASFKTHFVGELSRYQSNFRLRSESILALKDALMAAIGAK